MRRALQRSPDGSLYEDDVEYTAIDCQNENPGDASDASDIPTDVPDDPEGAGMDVGELDGCTAMFDNGVLPRVTAELRIVDIRRTVPADIRVGGLRAHLERVACR